jgi:uncharacterized sporulation protein YeaH/YhbH (DUF444 family)
MSRFIDKRTQNRHQSVVNRQRFIQRFKKQIQRSVAEAISKRSIQDLNSGENIKISKKDLSEPNFHFGTGGIRQIVLPGNKNFIPGDHIKRQESPGAGGSGSRAGNHQNQEEDDFGFQLNNEEFLNIFFEDLALPNLVKTQIQKNKQKQWVRAGTSSVGSPTNIHIVQSLKKALGRRISSKQSLQKKISALAEALKIEQAKKPQDIKTIAQIEEDMQRYKKRLNKIPFIEPSDLKYKVKVLESKPTNQAVMFCIMDVSGSMDEQKKDMAKKFFILLYLFLKKNYQKIDLIFIRHHTTAKEVDEKDFFYSRETGGTVVSSALELMGKIIKERYPAEEWNIYGAQASDGDNWNNDSPKCRDMLIEEIMPHTQYFAYVEIMPRSHQNLWELYLDVKKKYPQFAMQAIHHPQEIYLVLRELFKKSSQPTITEQSK